MDMTTIFSNLINNSIDKQVVQNFEMPSYGYKIIVNGKEIVL